MSFAETLKIIISADTAGAERAVSALSKSTGGLAASGKQAQGLAASADKIGSSMVRAGAATTASAAAMAAGIYKAAESAQSLADSVDKAQAVFGKSGTSSLKSFASGAADNLGKSKAAALDAASAYGVLLKQQGIGGKALADQSSALATRTADLAERFKKPYEEVQASIEKVLQTGSAKSLKGLLGVDIEIDPKKLAGLDTAAKTTEIYRQILDQTSASAGFFAKSQGDIGVSIQKAQAKWENAKSSFGEAAAPAIADLADKATELLKVFNDLPDGVKSAAGEIAVFGTIAAGIAGPIITIGGAAAKAVGYLSQMGGIGGKLGTLGGVLAAGTAAVVTWGIAWEVAAAKAKQAADDQASTVEEILKYSKPGSPFNQAQNQGLAETLAGKKKSDQGPISQIVDRFTGVSGPLGQAGSLAQALGLGGAGDNVKYVTRELDTLKTAIAQMAPADARANIADLKSRLEGLGVPADTVSAIITQLGRAVNDTGNAAGGASSGMESFGGAVERSVAYVSGATQTMVPYIAQLKSAGDAAVTFADKFAAVAQKLNQPADTASAAISAGLDLQEAQLRLAELDKGDKGSGAKASEIASKVADANNAVADALIRRRKAQEDLDKLTKRSVVAGSVPLIQQINKAADEAVKAAEGAAAQARMKFGAGSKEDVAAQANLKAAQARRNDAGVLLDKALAEQGGKNQSAIQAAKEAVASADRDVQKALEQRTKATQDSTGATKSAAQADIDRKRAQLGVADAQRRLIEADAKVAGAAADGEDPLNRLKDSLKNAGVSASDADQLVKGLDGSLQDFSGTLALIMGILANGSGAIQGVLGGSINNVTGGGSAGPGNAVSPYVYGPGGTGGSVPAGAPNAMPPGKPGNKVGDEVYKGGAWWIWDGRRWKPIFASPGKPNTPIVGGKHDPPIKRATGGIVPGSGFGDTVPAMLTPGEFIVTKAATQAIGTETLRALNKGNVARFSAGGLVRASTGSAGAGDVSSSAGSWSRGVEVKPVFHITTAAHPQVVANEVVRKMRRSTFLAGVR